MAGDALANPADMFGLGSRGAAMAGAHAAVADDSSANYYNPAGLARARDLRIDVGYLYAAPRLRIGGRDLGVDANHGLTAGLVAPGQLGPVRIAFGAAIFLPDEHVSRVRALAATQPRSVYYDNRGQRIFLGANLAIGFADRVFVGGGMAFMSRTQGTVELRGLVSFPDPALSDLRLDLDVDLKAVRYPQAGILVIPCRGVAIGLSYRHSFVLHLEQGFRVQGDVGAPGEPPLIADGHFMVTSSSTDLFQPLQLTLGLALRPLPATLLAFDLTYERWSDFADPAAVLTFDVDLKELQPLVEIPAPRVAPPARFHDILVPRLGVEQRLLDRRHLALLLRAGYGYAPSPVPSQIGETNFVDGDKHTFALGLGIVGRELGPIFLRPLAADLHLAYTLLPARATHKLSPVDSVGDYVADGHVLTAGVTLRLAF